MCSLVTEAWVQVGETALWSKWDASSTWHHLRHHCWWLITSLMMLKILAGPQLFTLDLVWINCWLIHKVGELRPAAWKHQQNCQHPVFRYCTGAEKGYLQAKYFATKVRKSVLRQSSKRKENDNIHWILFRILTVMLRMISHKFSAEQKNTVRGTMVPSEVCTSWCYC